MSAKARVDELIGRDVLRTLIRARTIEKMNILRQEFISLVQSIYEKEGVTRSFQTEWDGVFINKMLKPQSHLHTLDRIMKV